MHEPQVIITPKTTLLDKEPAIAVSTVTAFLTAILGMGAAFGLDLSEEQRTAVISVIAPTAAIIFLIGPVIRQTVFSPRTAQSLVNRAATSGKTDIN